MKFTVHQLSRQGGRAMNQDRVGYCHTREAALFAVADGLGGHPEGEVAADMVLQTLAAQFRHQADPALQDPRDFLMQALGAAHQRLIHYAARRRMADAPRTTIVACLLQGGAAYWAHCGDSRLYLVRADALVLRTRDHSHLELHAALSRAPPAGQRVSRHSLFTCLGSSGAPLIDVAGPTALQQGDRLLLCSDGLWDGLGDPHIAARMAAPDLAHAVTGLVDEALQRGGANCDNVTALALQWEGDTPLLPLLPLSVGDMVGSLAADADGLDDAETDRAHGEIDGTPRHAPRRKP